MTDNDDTITTAQFETAMYVLETLRDEIVPEEQVGLRRTFNEAHAAMQEERQQLDDGWDAPTEGFVTTPLSLREMVRCTPAAAPYGSGYDLVGFEPNDQNGITLKWEDPESDTIIKTDGSGNPAEPATPDDVPDECEIGPCENPIENFPEAFFPPEEAAEHADETGRAVMCDHHHVAARILAYTRPDPPYVDVGLYQEVTYYSRALAAESFGIVSTEKVNPPEEQDDE